MLRLERNDEIAASIEAFCQKHAIANAAISGIGSVQNPILAHYSNETRKFTTRNFVGIFEITALTGNVGLVDGRANVHAHITISDATMAVYGGHLMGGQCSATLEVIITSYASELTKSHNEAIGLNVWDLPEDADATR